MSNEIAEEEKVKALDVFIAKLGRCLQEWFSKFEKLQRVEPNNENYIKNLTEQVNYWRDKAEDWQALYIESLKAGVKEEVEEKEEKKKGVTA